MPAASGGPEAPSARWFLPTPGRSLAQSARPSLVMPVYFSKSSSEISALFVLCSR
ncbi:hypothetical protein CH063_11751 [Colletotrichum higginsianum]|uniref:Uncharacterized protein n=1 Tax=Colletotrichum higginsianum (strain IMI 349063) TaxID=759273 RepID=H1VMN8_COLHI|nr:hypothetical protein CH063_11751 [Colletotrichum higginsianum]